MVGSDVFAIEIVPLKREDIPSFKLGGVYSFWLQILGEWSVADSSTFLQHFPGRLSSPAFLVETFSPASPVEFQLTGSVSPF